MNVSELEFNEFGNDRLGFSLFIHWYYYCNSGELLPRGYSQEKRTTSRNYYPFRMNLRNMADMIFLFVGLGMLFNLDNG